MVGFAISNNYLRIYPMEAVTMANHTPEPWSIDKYGCVTAPSATALHRSIEVGGFALSGSQLAEFNSQRIVACVNACVGVSDDALDGGWEAAGLSAYAKRLEVDLSAVTAQRDELQELLKSSIDTLKTVADNCEWSHSDFPVIARAEAAIAKCEVKNDEH